MTKQVKGQRDGKGAPYAYSIWIRQDICENAWMHSHLKSFDFQKTLTITSGNGSLFGLYRTIVTINHDLKCTLYFLETHWHSGFCKSAWKDVSEVPEQALDIIFKSFLLLLVCLSPCSGCTPPTAWCIPPTKHVFCITDAPSNLSSACFELGRISFCLCSPSFPPSRSRWELKQTSSRGPSNLKNCVILRPGGLDADLPSQAFFQLLHYHSLLKLLLLGLHFAYPACLPAAAGVFDPADPVADSVKTKLYVLWVPFEAFLSNSCILQC